MARKALVSYLRASRGRTHRSNLEVEVQRDLCAAFARERGYRVVAEYVEIELSKGVDALELRPRLRAALGRARREHCPLVVSHLDRLARNVNFLSEVAGEGVALIVAGDDGTAPFTLGTLGLVAPRPGRRAPRTGTGTPGSPGADPRQAAAHGRRVIAEQADRFARNLLPVIRGIQGAGTTTLRGIAEALNARQIRTQRGARWTPTGVRRVLERANAHAAKRR